MITRSRRSVSRGAIIRLISLGVFVAAAVSVGLLLPPLDVDALRERFGDLGVAGLAAFAAIYGVLTLSPVPKGVLSIAAGVVWGFGVGVLAVYAGALLGATLAFWASRLLGREAVARLIGRRAAAIDDLFERRGFLSILGLRLVPVVPFTALNYASGLTGVTYPAYAAATAVGIIPGTAAYVALGAFGIEAGPLFWVALGALGALSLAGAIAGVVVQRRRRLRARAAGAASDAPAGSEQEATTDLDSRSGKGVEHA
ncbi:TVP38/TMEM64 family protein [Microbacterium kunmingense]|uniref:TVP38/TMEM64 family protein n=1 Tax=Microbacterium kunmingense TaxID=2915939 RepID=UPI003D73EA93